MPSLYLDSTEFKAYGVSDITTPEQVAQASTLIDAFMQRDEGLIIETGADGMPCSMKNLSPRASFSSVGAISPGAAVSITLTGPVGMLTVGDPLVIDRTVDESREVVTVRSLNGNVITADVKFAHADGCKLDAGLTITEQKYMPKGRTVTNLSRTPVCNVVSGLGRYGYTRRVAENAYTMNDYNLLAAMSHFGGPPIWEPWPVSVGSVDQGTGQLWIPAGTLLAYFTEIRVHYLAGWSYKDLPSPIKLACANIINGRENMPQFAGNMSLLKAGDVTAQRFAATVLDRDTIALLSPYVANIQG
jgi:hypothetical protein